jgi:hypothetical protein
VILILLKNCVFFVIIRLLHNFQALCNEFLRINELDMCTFCPLHLQLSFIGCLPKQLYHHVNTINLGRNRSMIQQTSLNGEMKKATHVI